VRWVLGQCVTEGDQVLVCIPCRVEGDGGPSVLGLTRVEPSGEGSFGWERLEGVMEEPLQAHG
jgi:hypothetical protein